ncbi:FecR family protein [Chryseobacterium sp. c4a]|uniref:FecR family protein n=1 Tax=Chryseobacterium sp. c4a TaxID=1573582 RepID=UPI00135B4153|nr:FecR family protein [Chryseobacterium sp. c4a]
MKTNNDILELFKSYLDGTISKEEFSRLLEYFSIEQNSNDLHEMLLMAIEEERDSIDEIGLHKTLALTDSHIYQMIEISKMKKSLFRKNLPYLSAAILIIIGIFSYFFFIEPNEIRKNITTTDVKDITPGTDRATLKLSSGSTYELNSDKNGIQTDSTGIKYTGGNKITDIQTIQNVTISTPRGGQYRVVLPDGTKVFLNSATTITYPTKFTTPYRNVELYGEAYFEVSHNPENPFIVKSTGQSIKVLGTKFNLYSFAGEPITTTLQEGKVEINTNERSSLPIKLSPGQQSILTGNRVRVKEVEVSDYIGWTKDVFIFNDTKLTDILLHISRWYDVDVVYPKDFKNESFYAEIPRNRKLSEVLVSLKHSGNSKFEIQGRRIIVKQ